MAARARPKMGTRLLAILLATMPGLAHVLVLERTGTGTLWFVLFVAGAQTAAWGRYLVDSEWSVELFNIGCAVAAGAWLVSFLDVVRLMLFRNYEKRAEVRGLLAEEGVRLYAAGKLDRARASFRRALDLDFRDVDILFWYGCVESRRGKRGRALRAFRRCLKYDHEGKWDFQILRERERLEAERAAPPPPPEGGAAGA